MGTDNPVADELVPLGVVFRMMPEGFGLEVIREAIEYRPRAKKRDRDRLNRRLRHLRIPGFRDGSRAAPAQLEIPALDAVLDGDDRLAGAVLRCWEEANTRLHKAVAAQLDKAAIQLRKGSSPDQFSGTWPDSEWASQRTAVLETHGDMSPDAVGLMLIVLTGKCPVPEDDGMPDVVSTRFVRWLDELEALPATASEWTDADEFARAVTMLGDAKGVELLLTVFQRRKDAVQELVDGYADELAYLDVDLSDWSQPDGRDSLSVALLAEELGKALAAYRPVRRQASSRTDEAKRAAQRAGCEDRILEIVARREALPKDTITDTDEEMEDADADLADEVVRLQKALADTRTELERLEVAHAKLREEHQSASEDNEGLRLSREQLGSEAARLRSEVARHRDAEERWRMAYVAARKARAVESDSATEVANIHDAVALAERAFPDELLIALNGKSDLSMPFAKPAEVFDALAWLATCYRRQGASPIGESCPGWFHKPGQTDSTMGRYREWYETSVGGRTLEISNHLGKGASFDPKSTIRIGFAWEAEHDRAVVGYIGRHQRTE